MTLSVPVLLVKTVQDSVSNETVWMLGLGVREVIGISSSKPWFWEQGYKMKKVMWQSMCRGYVWGVGVVKEKENLRRLFILPLTEDKGHYEDVGWSVDCWKIFVCKGWWS